MSKAQLVISAVVLEGRSKSEVARDYGVYRYWVQQLVCCASVRMTMMASFGLMTIRSGERPRSAC